MVISLLDSTMVKKAALHVQSLFQAYLPATLAFHDLFHTQQVVHAVKEIGLGCRLPASDIELLLIAAWFHDAGYIAGYQDHVELSQEIAKNWLKQEGMPATDRLKIIKCIGATQMPQSPRTILEEVICDADLIHLSAENYLSRLSMLREEWKNTFGKKSSERSWLTSNIDFLTNHFYLTHYGQKVLEERKEKNISHLLLLLQTLPH